VVAKGQIIPKVPLSLSLKELLLKEFLGQSMRKPSSRSRGCGLCLNREFRVLITHYGREHGPSVFDCRDLYEGAIDMLAGPVIHVAVRPHERWISYWHNLSKRWVSEEELESPSDHAVLWAWYDGEAFIHPAPDRSPDEIFQSWLNETLPDIALHTFLRDSRQRLSRYEQETNVGADDYLLDGMYDMGEYGYYRVVHSAVIHRMTRLELLCEPHRSFGGIPLSEWLDPAVNPLPRPYWNKELDVVKVIGLPRCRIIGKHPEGIYPHQSCADYIAVVTTLLGYTHLKANELALLLSLWLNALNEMVSRTMSTILASADRLGLPIPSIANG